MLEEALGAYLGTLNYKAAAVFSVEPRPDGLLCFARVYCMPISLKESDTYRTLLTAIPEGVSRADLDAFLARSVRERSEKSLAESEERLRIILDSVQAGLVIIDAEEHVIVDINPQASLMTGYEKEALMGRKCIDLFCVSEDGRCPIDCKEERVYNTESVVNHRTDGPIPVLTTVTAVDMKKIRPDIPVVISNRQSSRLPERDRRQRAPRPDRARPLSPGAGSTP
jgi:PAS domain S-box-containing protein